MKMFSLDDFSPDRFLSLPAGIGTKASFDATGLIRFMDGVMQWWLTGRLALAEGDLLLGAFGGDPAWASFASRPAIDTLLGDVGENFLPGIKGKILGFAMRYPEVQKAVEEAVQKLDDRIGLARAAQNRLAVEEGISPLRQSLDDYTSAYTSLNVARARVPVDAKVVEGARKQVALHFDQVTRAHAALKGGLDAINAAANRFWASLANLPAQKLTSAQWRSAQEYHAIRTALKDAWEFPPLAPIPMASFPAARGKNLFQRAFAAIRKK